MIVVSPCRSGRPAAERDARFFRHIGECTVVIVVVEPVLAEVRYINVRPPVVVVVSHDYTEAPAFVRDAGLFRNIRECAVMIVVQQHGARRRFLALQRGESRAIQQVNVQPAIVVVIEQRYAGSWRLENRPFLRRSRAMMEYVDAGRMRHVHKNDRRVINEASGRNRSRKRVPHRSVRRACAHAALWAPHGLFLRRVLLGQTAAQKQRCTNELCGDRAEEASRLAGLRE